MALLSGIFDGTWWLSWWRICLTCNAGDLVLIPGLGRSLWKREWQPTSVSLSGKLHGQKSLVGYCSWGHKESHMTEGLTLSLSFNLCCLEYVMLQGKRNFTDTIKFIKFKIRRSSSVLQIGPIYSTESVTAKRCLSSWVLRDSVEMRKAGERFKSWEAYPSLLDYQGTMSQRMLVVSGSREWCVAHIQQVNFRLTAPGSWTPPKTWVNLEETLENISALYTTVFHLVGLRAQKPDELHNALTFDTWKLGDNKWILL